MPAIPPTDREQRAAWRWRAEMLARRKAAFPPDPGAEPLKLTHNHVAVGQRLLDFAAGTGRAFPSHETLARRTGLSVGTVATALKLLAAAGLLAWVQTWVPNAGGFHGAKRQGPNTYSFSIPAEAGAAPYDPKVCGLEIPSKKSSFLQPAAQVAATAAAGSPEAKAAYLNELDDWNRRRWGSPSRSATRA